MRTALVLPPLTQLNTPFPGALYLARFLRDQGEPFALWDLGQALALRLLSAEGLREVFEALGGREELPEPAWEALADRERHLAAVGPVVRFLQGRDRSLARRLLDSPLLPRTPRLQQVDLAGLGPAAVDDAARHLASLYVADLFDLVASTLDPGVRLSSYQAQLAQGPARFEPLLERLGQTTIVDRWLETLLDERLAAAPDVDVLALSVPFPGTLYGALRIGRRARQRGIGVILGGGYVSTELRDTDEPRLWAFIDALSWDDGEGPLLAFLQHRRGGPDRRHRTLTREGRHEARVEPPRALPIALYDGLDLGAYLDIVDTLNPAHRLWGDGRWNKLTLAHGCYWKRCAFCDLQLDYIARYEPARVEALVEAMAELVRQTGQTGFHLVDEAAPPRLLRDLALALLARGLTVSLWGNIRFERAFTPDLCRLLARAGLVMVTGGLEVASDRLLALMDKGITVEQAARAALAFQRAGVRVHAYLMYGFPTQTAQETVDSLELVRQLFAEGLLDSAFWHRFVLTRHSGVALDPARYQVRVPDPGPRFAQNDLPHQDPTAAIAARFDGLLEPPLQAWMRGQRLAEPVHVWLPRDLPRAREPADRIARAIDAPFPEGERPVWLGGEVLEGPGERLVAGLEGPVRLRGGKAALGWLDELLEAARPGRPALRWSEVLASFPGQRAQALRLLGPVRGAGLVLV